MSISEKIWRDKHGVCHVKGKDKADIFNLMGYVHGKDRGMQIILKRLNFPNDSFLLYLIGISPLP